ncbi:hypothetical protein FI667_g1209, partial [Globisporangium splendens]
MHGHQRYVDEAGFSEYTANAGQELVVSLLVDATVDEAFDALLKYTWVGKNKELAPGVGRGLVGHIREAPGGFVEEILSAGLPQGDDAIASICYELKVDKSWTAKTHIALISFVPDTTTGKAPTDKTLIQWAIKMTPTSFGNVALCGGSLLRAALRVAVSGMLKSLKKKLNKLKRQ